MNSNIQNERLLGFGFNLQKMNFKTFFLSDSSTFDIKYVTFYNKDIKQWHIISYSNGYFDYGDLYYENAPADKEHPATSDINIGQYYMSNEFSTKHIKQFLNNAKEYENEEDTIPTNIRKEFLNKWIADKDLILYSLSKNSTYNIV